MTLNLFLWLQSNRTKSSLTNDNKVPDRDDVREKHNKSKKVAEPRTDEALQRYHDDRQNHLSQEQGLGEAVQLQIQ